MHNELIMELSREQGPGRETQVQPPKAVWEQYFGLRLDASVRPTYRLEDMGNPGEPEQRKVVRHDHNFTLEIGGAIPPRPAIIRIRRIGVNSFGYWVYRPPGKDYGHCKWLLDTFAEEDGNRRWVIINPSL